MNYDDFLKQHRILMAQVIHEGFGRLTDPGYQPDLTRADANAGGQTKQVITLEELVLSGLLPPGTLLSPSEAETETLAEITLDGQISMNERFYDSPTRAARDDGADINDGWAYWVAYINDKPIQLDDLRRIAEKSDGAVDTRES